MGVAWVRYKLALSCSLDDMLGLRGMGSCQAPGTGRVCLMASMQAKALADSAKMRQGHSCQPEVLPTLQHRLCCSCGICLRLLPTGCVHMHRIVSKNPDARVCPPSRRVGAWRSPVEAEAHAGLCSWKVRDDSFIIITLHRILYVILVHECTKYLLDQVNSGDMLRHTQRAITGIHGYSYHGHLGNIFTVHRLTRPETKWPWCTGWGSSPFCGQ